MPEQPLRLGTARIGEGNRSWSAGAGAGAGAMATGAVQVAWILDQLRRRAPNAKPFLDWNPFTRAGHGLFLWEAFVTDRAKAATHVDDAVIAATAFRNAFPDVTGANAVTADRPLWTVVSDGAVAGNIGCWEDDGRRLVGYWIGREFWGRGLATQSLAELLDVVDARPLHAYVAKSNVASIRVLEKCGFVKVGERAGDDGIEELLLELRA